MNRRGNALYIRTRHTGRCRGEVESRRITRSFSTGRAAGSSRGSLDRYGGLPEANQRDADREGQMRRNTGNATNQRDADRDADLMERRLQNHNTKNKEL